VRDITGASVPGVGDNCVATPEEAVTEFTLLLELFIIPADLLATAALPADLEDKPELVEVLLLEPDVEDELIDDVEFEASLLRDDPDDDRDCEVTSDELADEDCELDPEATVSTSFCTFAGGSYTNKTTIINLTLMQKFK